MGWALLDTAVDTVLLLGVPVFEEVADVEVLVVVLAVLLLLPTIKAAAEELTDDGEEDTAVSGLLAANELLGIVGGSRKSVCGCC